MASCSLISSDLPRLGWVNRVTGNYERSRQLNQQNLKLLERRGDQRGMGNALNSLGFVAKHRGELDEAERLQRDGLACMRKAGAEKDVARLLKDFSATLIWNGKFEEAMQKTEESHRIYENLGLAENFYQIMISIVLLLDQGEIEQAVELYALARCYAYIRNSRRFQDLAGEELGREAARLGKERLKELQAHGQSLDLWLTAEWLQAAFPDWAAKSYQTPIDLTKTNRLN